jgi:transcriptional regulator with XRE-family HTH domain
VAAVQRKTRKAKRIVAIQRRFGAQVRVLRHAKGWSLERFAGEARLHWTYLAGIERGERNVSLVNIEKIALALKVPIERLFAEPK